MIIGLIIGLFFGAFIYDRIVLTMYKDEFNRIERHQDEMRELRATLKFYQDYINSTHNK